MKGAARKSLPNFIPVDVLAGSINHHWCVAGVNVPISQSPLHDALYYLVTVKDTGPVLRNDLPGSRLKADFFA